MRRAPFLLGRFVRPYDILRRMTKVLQEAVAQVGRLPASDQENIGRQVLQHVEKLRLLRDDIDAGVRELDAGEGLQLELDDVIAVARMRHGKKG